MTFPPLRDPRTLQDLPGPSRTPFTPEQTCLLLLTSVPILKETPQPPGSSRSPLESSGFYKTLQEPPKDPSNHNITLQEPPIQFTNFWLTFPPLGDPRTLQDLPGPSRTSHIIRRTYFFQQFKIQIWFKDISGSIALSEDFEYSFRSFLCQFSNEWHGRTIEWI